MNDDNLESRLLLFAPSHASPYTQTDLDAEG